jgi:hypothetical protein
VLCRLLGDGTSLSTEGKGESGSRSSSKVKDCVDDGVKRGNPDVVPLGAGNDSLDLDWPSDIRDGVYAPSSPNEVDDGVRTLRLEFEPRDALGV